MAKRTGPSSVKSVLSIADRAAAEVDRLAETRRRLLADWCKLVDARLKGKTLASPEPARSEDPLAGVHLTPRMRQILDRLLAGDGEKQIAQTLGISTHTVHTYVKRLHKTLGVSSRGELLARFVR